MREHRPVMRRSAGLGAHLLVAFLVVGLVRPAAYARPSLLPVPVEQATTAGSPRLAVVVVGQDVKARASLGVLEQAAEDAADRAARFELVRSSDAWEPSAVKAHADAADAAAAKVKEGQKAIDDLDNQKATEALNAALAEFRKTDLTRTYKDFLQAWVLEAGAHAIGGENALAKKEIEAIIAANPKAEFSSQLFPPDLLKFAEQQRKIAGNAKAELTVRTEPPGARVWVDGVLRGPSPVTVAGLMAGKHQVVAALGGYATALEDASPGEELVKLKPAELGPQLTKTIELIMKDPDGPTRDAALRSLGKQAGLDQVLLVLAKKSLAGEKLDLVVERIEVKDGHNPGYVTRTVAATDADLAPLLDVALARDQPRAGKSPVTHFQGGSGGSGRKVVGFTLMGVGVAAIGAGVICGLQANAKVAEYQQTRQVQTQISQNLATQGHTFALIADVSYIAGAAAIITGGIVAFTGGGSSTTLDEPAPKKTDSKKKDSRPDTKKKDDAKKDETKKDDAKKDSGKKDEAKKADSKRADEEKKKADDEKKAREDEARRKADDDRAAAEQKKRDDEERKKKEEEERDSKKKKTKKEIAQEEKKKKDEEAAKKKADEEAAKKKKEEDAAAKKKDDEDKKHEEERKKKEADDKKKKEEDDLRNY